MGQQLNQLQEVLWIILPLLVLYLGLLIIGLRDWIKKRELLGQYKFIWLLIIVLFSMIGPIVYLVNSHRLTSEEMSLAGYDDWRD
ncbi:MAG: PLDc N-terminal domain-containing protein [Candidatus Hodarchaeota archaeon]